MSDFRFELNEAGVRALLKSSEMQAILSEYGSKVMGRVGEGYEMTAGTTSQRAKVNVRTETPRAMVDNLKNNTLLKALGG